MKPLPDLSRAFSPVPPVVHTRMTQTLEEIHHMKKRIVSVAFALAAVLALGLTACDSLPGSGGHGAAAAVYLLLQACVLVLALLARRTVLNSDWQPEGCGGLTTE